MRVVYDTNVLAAILSRREEILRLKQSIATGQVTLITSPIILEELEAVLTERFKLTKQGSKSRVRLLARVSETVNPKSIEKIVRDPSDDAILATAVTGKAEFLITSDKDLLVINRHKGISIITLAEFNQL